MTDAAVNAETSLLIISHGSSVEPDGYEPVFACARRLARRSEFARVAVGFHKQEPTLRQGWQGLDTARVVVVPYLASAGYFAARYLPGQLGLEEGGFDEVVELDGRRVIYTEPVGTHRRMWELTGRVAGDIVDHRMPDDVDIGQVTLVVVGHGTPRHGASGKSVRDCVATLEEQRKFADVLEAFVDEKPFVDGVLDRCSTRDVVVIPYFVANGPHVTGDIPEGLGIDADALWTGPHETGGRRLWYAEAIGIEDEVCELVADRALVARRQMGDS